MHFVERDILVDPNESGDYWYIPVTFHNSNWDSIEDMSDYDIHISASTVTLSNNVEEYHELVTTGWALSYEAYFYALKVPKVTTNYQFTQYIRVYIYLEDKSTFDVVSIVILNIRKSPVGGSSAPTAEQIAKAVWNYADDDPDEDMLGERTLSSTVEVDPATIAEVVWNYGNEDEAITTRTLTNDVDLSSITAAIGNLPTASDIASSVLQTDVAQAEVSENGYTLTHLIMASQRSRVRIDGSKHLWEILKGDAVGTVIATRELTLNQNGAIVETETASSTNQEVSQEETE